jgi:protein-tyrosine phosphatase
MLDGSTRYAIGIDSAGLDVQRPLPPPPNAIEAAGHFGIDLQAHRSKQFAAAMYDDFDMIVAMEAGQYHALGQSRNASYAKLFLLPFFENSSLRPGGYERYNVADPYGKGIEEFIRCFQRIERCLAGMAKLIHAL